MQELGGGRQRQGGGITRARAHVWAMPVGDRAAGGIELAEGGAFARPPSSPESARRAAGPSTATEKGTGRRAGSPIRVFTCARKGAARRAHGAQELGQRCLSRRARQDVPGVARRSGRHGPTTISSRIDDGGRLKSQSAAFGHGSRANRSIGDQLRRGNHGRRAGCDERGDGAPRKSAAWRVARQNRWTWAPAESPRSARAVGAGALAHHTTQTAGHQDRRTKGRCSRDGTRSRGSRPSHGRCLGRSTAPKDQRMVCEEV